VCVLASDTAATSRWQLVGARGFSEQTAASLSLSIATHQGSSGGATHVGYADGGKFMRATVRIWDVASSSWLVLGKRGFSVGKVTSLSVATESGSLAAATGVLTPWVAYADKALQNRVVIRKWNVISGVWEDVGGVDVGTIGTAMSSGAARDINLLLLPPLHLDTTPDARLTPLVTYIVHTNAIDSKAIARTFDGSKDTDTSGSDGASRAWPTVGSNGLLGFSIGRATGLVGAPARLFTPDAQGEERVQLLPEVLVAYQDASQGSKLMVENVRLLSSEGISSSSVCGETPYPTPMESTRAPTPRPTPQPSSMAPTPRAVTRGPTGRCIYLCFHFDSYY
jgi:hypothetical protein